LIEVDPAAIPALPAVIVSAAAVDVTLLIVPPIPTAHSGGDPAVNIAVEAVIVTVSSFKRASGKSTIRALSTTERRASITVFPVT
jgi:hypothetical protein